MDKKETSIIGMHMKRIRTEHNLTQQQVCDRWPREDGSTVAAIDRTVYAKYENGTLMPSDERIEQFASIFTISPEELKHMYQSTAIVIPDTSALLNNSLLLEMLMKDFDQVVIASTVQLELSDLKNRNDPNKKKASKIIATINDLFDKQNLQQKTNPKSKKKISKEDSENIPLKDDSKISTNDRKLIALAQKLAKKTSRKVFIIHYDKDIPFFSDDTISNIKLSDYIVQRDSTPSGYQTILDFDEEFDNIVAYEKLFENLDKKAINAYLPNGMTLLISCINCNSNIIINKRGRQIPESRVKAKIQFLINHGADINKTDNNRYCHTPLQHCISQYHYKYKPYFFDIFKMLINEGADYNKGSVDETKFGDRRLSEKNEGNTPLMVACWEGKKVFVKTLLEMPDLSINQQDCNGFTALIKCAVQRYNRKKDGKSYKIYEELYQLLKEKGADTKIRDRNNRTAQDWWNMGDSLANEEEEL